MTTGNVVFVVTCNLSESLSAQPLGIYTGQISVELISSSSAALVRNDPGLLMASLWRQSSSLHRLGRQCCQTQARLSQDLSMPPPTTFADSEERWDLPLRKRLEADAAE